MVRLMTHFTIGAFTYCPPTPGTLALFVPPPVQALGVAASIRLIHRQRPVRHGINRLGRKES